MNITDLRKARERIEPLLGFSLPPYRPEYEQWRTDFGIGSIGLHWIVLCVYLPAYRAARFNVAGAAEINEDRIAEAIRGGLEAGKITQDWRELARREEVKILDCVFGHRRDGLARRLAVIEEAAKHGKHVLIQKPVAHTLGMAGEYARIAREAGIIVAVNHNCRYQPVNYTTKQLLTPERLGKPRVIELRKSWGGSPRPRESAHPHASADHTIHHADLIRWWVDEPCVSVYAKSLAHCTVATYEFADGCIVTHSECHHGARPCSSVHILAEKGSIEQSFDWSWDDCSKESLRVMLEDKVPPIEIPHPTHVYEPGWSQANPWDPRKGPFYDLAGTTAGMMGTMASLMRAVETGLPADNGIAAATESLRMILAAQLSAKTGKPVDPRDLPEDAAVVN